MRSSHVQRARMKIWYALGVWCVVTVHICRALTVSAHTVHTRNAPKDSGYTAGASAVYVVVKE